MRLRPSPRARIILACVVAISTATAGLRADDVHLADSTVMVLSTGDVKAMKTALEASDTGRLLADPEFRRIGENMKKGLAGHVKKGMQEAAANAPEGTDPAAMQAMMTTFLDLGKSYLDAACDDMSGRAAFSLGIAMDPALPTPMPSVIIEFGGTDRLHTMHGQLIETMITLSEGEAKKAEFTAGGFQFSGLEESGMGLFFGRKGDRFIVGSHRAGLADYITATEAGTERLGAQPFYKSAFAATGTGQMNFFLGLSPIWTMAMGMMAMTPVADGEPNPAAIMQSLGLTDIQGMAATATWTAQGASSRSFIALAGRRGLLRLIPTENLALALPPFAPSEVVSASTTRLELSQILNLVRDLMALAPGAEKSEFEAGIAQSQEMLGVSLDELLSDLEGTVFTSTPADAAPMNPMAMMMGGGAGLDLSFAMRLKSKERFQKLFATLSSAEFTQGMLSKSEVAGREVWSMMVPLGPAPMQVACSVDGEWLIFATGAESIRKAYERAEAGKSLGGNEVYNGLVQRLGGSTGMMIAYTDTGKTMGQWLDMIRPILGMVPMFVPDLAQNPETLFIFDVANLPSSALVQKYLGATVTRGRVTKGGLLFDAWSPTKSAPKTEGTKPAEAGAKPGAQR